MQAPGMVPVPAQFVDTGTHWKRLAKKNAMVQAIVTAIMALSDRSITRPQRSLDESTAESSIFASVLLTFCKSKALPV